MVSEPRVDWAQSCCHVVVSSSLRLGEDWCRAVETDWSGPIVHHREPPAIAELLLGMDTPSLFEEPSLLVVHGGDAYAAKHRESFVRRLGVPLSAGAVLLVLDKLPAKDALYKAAKAAQALHQVDVPSRPAEVRSWLIAHLHQLSQGVENPSAVAQALMDHRGEQVDALLAGLDQAVDHATDRLQVSDVEAAVGGSSDRPAWDLSSALFDGKLRRCLELLYSGKGLAAEQVLSALAGELRRCLCALASDDDREVAALAGISNPAQVRFARRRATALRRRACERLLRGVTLTQRAIRHGDDPELAIELLMLNAQRVIRPH